MLWTDNVADIHAEHTLERMNIQGFSVCVVKSTLSHFLRGMALFWWRFLGVISLG